MEIIKKGITPENIDIQLENWSKDYPTIYKGATVIAAYPTSKLSVPHYINNHFTHDYPKRGEKFRLSITFPTSKEAQAAYENLILGATKLSDYVNLFDDTPNTKRENFLHCLVEYIL